MAFSLFVNKNDATRCFCSKKSRCIPNVFRKYGKFFKPAAGENIMFIENRFFKLELNDANGAIKSLKNKKQKELISYSANRSLVAFWVFNEKSGREILDSNANDGFTIKQLSDTSLELAYENIGKKRINAQAYLRWEENSPFLYWSMKVQNNGKMHIDQIDFPKVVVPNDLVATGGTGKIFTSMVEGVVFDDIERRESMNLAHNGLDMNTGWRGIYPGSCQTQFSAYYSEEGGLYFAAHDKFCNPKIIEVFKEDEGIKLEFKLYPGKNDTSNFGYEFEMVLGVFEGDWYDAAEIYRAFIEQSGLITLPKLKNNNNVPAWLKESPIVVCYPVRGQIDTELKECDEWEYYPYTKATPYLKQLQVDTDSVLMPLLMHWEGTAPWAPPYVWPPYGDFKNFEQFIEDMHNAGNYVGVYCSGISWTQSSILLPSYNRESEFESCGWKDSVIVDSTQEIKYTWQAIRYSYELCPSCQQTKDVAISEFEKIIANSDVDYVQYFDQNLGGGTYSCYAKHHNHAFGPGKWQNEEMLKIGAGMYDILVKYGKEKKVLIGCEANAAEPYVNRFVFNDSRHNINYQYGYPVPAYNYIFHEYVSNFMGNQNSSYGFTDFARYPQNIYYRFAHSYVQGDVLTVVLKDKGKIHWDWCTPWNAPEIDQKEIKAFIRELNTWRKNAAKASLLYGRMVKPFSYECGVYDERYKNSEQGHNYPSVESACYIIEGGNKQQVFVNYMPYEQTITIKTGREQVKFIEDAFGEKITLLGGGEITLTLPARSVRVLETAKTY